MNINKFVKLPKDNKKIQIVKFFEKIGLSNICKDVNKNKKDIQKVESKEILGPDLEDLYRLWNIVYLNKRTCVLEFGSGYSSLVISNALSHLKNKYIKKINHLRRNNKFEHFILENEKKYLNITKKRIIKHSSVITNKIHFNFSNVKMSLMNNRIVTIYDKLPLCVPDFIFLDGPNQFKVKSDINGISTRHNDMLPMVGDLIKLEYFFLPGTIILVDGRGANVFFLKNNFQRNWLYNYNKNYDQHILYLNDKSIGPLNKKLIKFYNC